MEQRKKAEWENEYAPLLQFINEHKRISYSEFDNHILQDIPLFVVPKDEHFGYLEYALDKIVQALPALKRIFSKPITRLKDVHNILPIESVRVINNESVAHVARHSELWGDINDEGLKPKKLLTLDRQEDYAIYENVAFARLIDYILAFIRRNVRLLNDVLYSHRDLYFNLLERTNHLQYFLAVGKLHIGYAHAQEKHSLVYEHCLEKLLFIEKTLCAKLHAPVYRHCRKNTAKLTLKKTNVFRLQKDYKQVYNLLKWFNGEKKEIDAGELNFQVSKKAYAAYCNLLSVFAIGHFNFSFNPKSKLNFTNLNAESSFLSWKLQTERVEKDAIMGLRFSFFKDCDYRICLLFYDDAYSVAQIEAFKSANPADEYLLTSPLENGGKDCLYLSLFDVDSFRRIQRLLLRGMAYSDAKRDLCPFCGKPLTKTVYGGVCHVCHTEIHQKTCPETGTPYLSTKISDFKPALQKAQTRKERYLFEKYAEASLHYRNITPITPTGEPLCPHCGNFHE